MQQRKRTDAVRRAEAKYKDAHYDKISIRIPKGDKDKWKDEAAKRGLSLIRLMVNGIEEYIQNHPVEGEKHGEEN